MLIDIKEIDAILLACFRNNSLPMAIANFDMKLIEANDAACEMLQYKKEEIPGKSIFDLSQKGTAAFDIQKFAELKSGLIRSYTITRNYVTKKGALVDGAITVSKIEMVGKEFFMGIFQLLEADGHVTTHFQSHSFDFLSNILSSSPDIHYFLDVAQRKHIYENKSVLGYLGYGKMDLNGMNEVDFLMSIVDRSSIVHYGESFKLNQITSKQQFTEAEYRIKCKDGSWKWLRERATPIKFDKNKRASISYGILLDITEKRGIYDRVKEQQLFIEKVAETVPDVIYVFELNPLKAVYSNFRNSDFLGYTEAEWSDLRLEHVHPDDIETVENLLFDISEAKDDDIIIGEVQYKAKSGEYKWVLNKSRVFKRDKDGSPAQILSITSDISDFKNTVSQLEESESTKSAILQAIPELLIKMNVDGVCTEVISEGHRESNTLPKDVVGRNLKDIATKKNAEILCLKLREAIKEQEIVSIETDSVIDGKDVYYISRFSPLNEEEAIVMVSDITGTKEMQKSLDQKVQELSINNEKLEHHIRKNTELERFAFIVSHDLKEPIRSIKAFSDILNKNYRDSFDDDAKTYVDFITAGIDRMNNLVEGILNFSRIDSQGNKFEQIDLNLVYDKILEDLSLIISEKEAKIVSDKLPMLMCDQLQIRQLLQNLISNGIKFTKDLKPDVKIKCERKGEFYEFCVSDNGIGIREHQIDNIFAIFKKLHGQHEFSGQGIGLSICKKIVERHGGEIWAESVYAKGTCIFFTLPAA